MTDEKPIQYRGAFIPFPVPIAAIVDDPTGASDWGLCLSDAWRPAVLGALKVLCRPETWVGTEDDIKTAMLGAQKILGAVIDDCSSEGIPFACPFDMTTDDFDGIPYYRSGYTPPESAEWVSTVGWKSVTQITPGTGNPLRECVFDIPLSTPVKVQRIVATYSYAQAAVPAVGYSNHLGCYYLGGTVGQHVLASQFWGDQSLADFELVLTSPALIDDIDWYTVQHDAADAIALGSCEVHSITLYGFGDPPSICA